MFKTFVNVKTSFAACHRWPTAPDNVAFLRAYHRHEFGVTVSIPVSHQDRDVEFFTFKAELDAYLQSEFAGRKFDHSCETIGRMILDRFPTVNLVNVDEDDQNSSTVVRSPAYGVKIENTWGGEGCVSGVAEAAPQPTTHTSKPTVRVSEQVRRLPFVGVECEGPEQGRQTLFIPDGVSRFEIELALGKMNNPFNLYMGAGNLTFGSFYGSAASPKDLADLLLQLTLKKLPILSIWVEIESFSGFKQVVQHIPLTTQMGLKLVSRNLSDINDYKASVDFVKFTTATEVIWVGVKERDRKIYRTPLDHPEYAKDRTL